MIMILIYVRKRFLPASNCETGGGAGFTTAVILQANPGNWPSPPMTFSNGTLVRFIQTEMHVLWLGLFALALLARPTSVSAESLPLTYQVLASKDHDRRVFTQGLVLKGKVKTESSGLYGKSFVVQYNADTGAVQRRLSLPREYFAEGITEFNGLFFLLTWKAGLALILDQNLQQVASQPYQGEGWGITHNGQYLIMSNGTDTLSMRRAADFSVMDTLQVKDGDRPVHNINELEFAEELIWANVWQEPVILAIDPETGTVKGTADLSELVRPNNSHPGESVLNGIAYDPEQRAFWITGKWWPKRYLVRFNWPQANPPTPAEPLITP
jgi:glutamine cyclotransferase